MLPTEPYNNNIVIWANAQTMPAKFKFSYVLWILWVSDDESSTSDLILVYKIQKKRKEI